MTKNSAVYIYATEMVSSYYSKLTLKNKNVLSVSGSGDQILDAYFFEAKEVFSFDINKNSLFMTELKFVAVELLSYQEFLEFFGTNFKNASFDYKLYNKIQPNLSKATAHFFDFLYKDNKYVGNKLTLNEEHFRRRGDILFRPASEINIYLKNQKKYLYLRNIIKDKKINFIQSDIINIIKKIPKNKKFDIINLSNVINYLERSMEPEERKKYLIDLIISFKKILSKKGQIFFYAYSLTTYPNKEQKGVPPSSDKLFIKNLIEKTKSHYLLESKRFAGVHKKGNDKIIVLTKR